MAMTSPPMAHDVALMVTSMVEVFLVVRNLSSMATIKTSPECLRLGFWKVHECMYTNRRNKSIDVKDSSFEVHIDKMNEI